MLISCLLFTCCWVWFYCCCFGCLCLLTVDCCDIILFVWILNYVGLAVFLTYLVWFDCGVCLRFGWVVIICDCYGCSIVR